jgi:hypothetical protein
VKSASASRLHSAMRILGARAGDRSSGIHRVALRASAGRPLPRSARVLVRVRSGAASASLTLRAGRAGTARLR